MEKQRLFWMFALGFVWMATVDFFVDFSHVHVMARLTGYQTLFVPQNQAQSSGGDTSASQPAAPTQSTSTVNQTLAEAALSAANDPERQNKEGYNFDGKVATLRDVTLTITEFKLVENDGKKLLAFWYEVENHGETPIEPNGAWFAVMSATQTYNNQTVRLEVGSLPMDYYKDRKDITLQKGGKGSDVIAYEIDNPDYPVVLTAHRGMGGVELGKAEYLVSE